MQSDFVRAEQHYLALPAHPGGDRMDVASREIAMFLARYANEQGRVEEGIETLRSILTSRVHGFYVVVRLQPRLIRIVRNPPGHEGFRRFQGRLGHDVTLARPPDRFVGSR